MHKILLIFAMFTSYWLELITAQSKCPKRLEFTPSKLWVVSEHQVDYSDFAGRSDLWSGVIGVLGFNCQTQPKFQTQSGCSVLDTIMLYLLVCRSLKASGQIWRKTYDLYWPKKLTECKTAEPNKLVGEQLSSGAANSVSSIVSQSNGCTK